MVIFSADRKDIVFRRLADSILCQIHEHLGFRITDSIDLARRYQYLLAGKPASGLDDQVTNRPTLIVHHKISDVSDYSIARLDVVAADGLCAP